MTGDGVNRVLAEREALDTGLGVSLAASGGLHALLLAGVVASFFFGRAPLLQVQTGFVVPLPRGGGGTPGAPAPAPAPAQAPTVAASAEPAPAPAPEKVLKPPREEPRRALPELDTPRRRQPRRERAQADPRSVSAPRPAAGAEPAARGTTPGGTGTVTGAVGIGIGPPGPGVPDGTDLGGDWYLAGVQRKIWMIWLQQVQTGHTTPIRVSFTILADGGVEDVRVLDPSPVALLNLAAQRAVVSAAPFGPLPRTYGTQRFTIHAVFKPTAR